MIKRFLWVIVLTVTILTNQTEAQSDFTTLVAEAASEINEEVIAWRRHFHEYPELSNREFQTAKTIAEELDKLGLPYETGIAHTGVVAVLDSGKPGPTIGLRADIDGLPVVERTSLSFASKATSTYLGEDVGVMHACGHDTHIAMLLGTAKILTKMKSQLRGKVVFVFQRPKKELPKVRKVEHI